MLVEQRLEVGCSGGTALIGQSGNRLVREVLQPTAEGSKCQSFSESFAAAGWPQRHFGHAHWLGADCRNHCSQWSPDLTLEWGTRSCAPTHLLGRMSAVGLAAFGQLALDAGDLSTAEVSGLTCHWRQWHSATWGSWSLDFGWEARTGALSMQCVPGSPRSSLRRRVCGLV